MLIYLDSKDLIELLERSSPCSATEFGSRLRDAGHELVISPPLVYEISEPLLKRDVTANVMQLLNALESLPHVFFGQNKMVHLELEEAIRANGEAREYRQVDPFVARFDFTLAETPDTWDLLSLHLAEIVWELWHRSPEIWSVPSQQVGKYRSLLHSDRRLKPAPTLAEHFATAIERDYGQFGIDHPKDITALAGWIYALPSRCPSLRLNFEVYHKLRMNCMDVVQESDLDDFAHVDCVPYVDLITLDKRMRTYVRQASQGMNAGYERKLCANTADILNRL